MQHELQPVVSNLAHGVDLHLHGSDRRVEKHTQLVLSVRG
jgi:hypothetical protein